jgi:hypothetical protein
MDIRILPPFPRELISSSYHNLCGRPSTSALLEMEGEWKFFVGACMHVYSPQALLHADEKNDGRYVKVSNLRPPISALTAAEFWSTRQQKMQHLYKVHRRVSCLPMSTASVERTFNGLQKVLSDDRKGRLSEDSAQAELFIRTSLSFNFNFKQQNL